MLVVMNPNLFISECPCYLGHVAASYTNDVFNDMVGLNKGNVCFDGYCWFEKSSNGKQSLKNTLNLVIKKIRLLSNIFEHVLNMILKKLPIHTS